MRTKGRGLNAVMASAREVSLIKAKETAALVKRFEIEKGTRHPFIIELQDALAAVVRGKTASVELYSASLIEERALEEYAGWIVEVRYFLAKVSHWIKVRALLLFTVTLCLLACEHERSRTLSLLPASNSDFKGERYV